MLLILTHSTPLKREFPHICKSESKFLNFAVAFTSYKLAFTFASEQKQANFSMKFTCRRYSPPVFGPEVNMPTENYTLTVSRPTP